jgi:hypothetical protein
VVVNKPSTMLPVWGMANTSSKQKKNIWSTAWDDISPESIIRGFKKCCVSNDMNGTEDDVLWEEDHEENSSSYESVDSD